jgi:hypothetical protein
MPKSEHLYRQPEQRFARRCRNVHRRLHAASSPADVANCELRQYCAELHLPLTDAAQCHTAKYTVTRPVSLQAPIKWSHLPPTSAVRQCAMFVLIVRNWKGRAFGRAKSSQFQTKLHFKTGSKPQKQSDNRDRQTDRQTEPLPRKSIFP